MNDITDLGLSIEVIGKVQEYTKEKFAEIMAQREEILHAFIAKYGCQPDEIQQLQNHHSDRVVWYLGKISNDNEWTALSDRAPTMTEVVKDDGWFIVCCVGDCGSYARHSALYLGNGRFYLGNEDMQKLDYRVTHFRPMIAPPQKVHEAYLAACAALQKKENAISEARKEVVNHIDPTSWIISEARKWLVNHIDPMSWINATATKPTIGKTVSVWVSVKPHGVDQLYEVKARYLEKSMGAEHPLWLFEGPPFLVKVPVDEIKVIMWRELPQ